MHYVKKIFKRSPKKRDGAQTTSPSPSPSVPHASGSASPAPLNPTDRPSSAPPIGRARRVGNEYEPSHPYPSTSTNEPPQPVPDILIHGPPSVPHVSNIDQDSSEPVPSHLDLAAPRPIPPYNYRSIQDGFNTQPPVVRTNDGALLDSNLGVPAASSSSSLSTPENPIHRLPSPTPATATLQGATEYDLRPSLINTLDPSRSSNRSTAVCACYHEIFGLLRSPH